MKNEEIAYQLHPYCPIYNDFAMEKQDVNSEVRTGFIEGANWKDNQFKEYLQKKREGVRMEIEKCSRNTVKEYSLVMVREYFDEIINELFGETKTNTDKEE